MTVTVGLFYYIKGPTKNLAQDCMFENNTIFERLRDDVSEQGALAKTPMCFVEVEGEPAHELIILSHLLNIGPFWN